jgi:hypothetical protein
MAALELLRPRAELVRVHVFFSTTLLRSSRSRREGFGSQDQFHGWAVMSLLLARLEKSCSTKKVIPCLTACDLDCTSYMWPTFKNASSSGLAWPPTSRCFGVLHARLLASSFSHQLNLLSILLKSLIPM